MFARKPFLALALSITVLAGAGGGIAWLWRNVSHIEAALPVSSLNKERDFAVLLLDVVRLEAAVSLAYTDPAPEKLDQARTRLDLARLRLADNRSLYGRGEPGIGDLQDRLGESLSRLDADFARSVSDPQRLRDDLDVLAGLRQELQTSNDSIFQNSIMQVSAQHDYLANLRHSMSWLVGLFGLASLALIVSLAKRRHDILALEAQGAELRASEARIRESETLLHAVIDEMPDVMVLKDHQGNFLLCNRTVARLYKTTPEAMIGKDDGDFGVPPEMAEFFRQNVLAIMARGETEVVFEDSRDAATGEIRHYKSIKKPIRDSQGRSQILVIAHDITDIVRAQEKIALSERRLQDVMAATREGIWDWSIATGQVLHNKQWYEMLGYADGELADTVEAFSSVVHAPDRELVWQRLEAMLQGESPAYYSEHRLVCKDGSLIWVQDRGRIVERDATGAPARVVGSFAEITQRKHDEQALIEERQRLSNILWGTGVGTWEWQVQTGEVRFNERWAEMLGYTLDELAPLSIETWQKLAHPDDLARSMTLLERHFHGETDYYEVEARMRHRDGRWLWVLDRGKLISRTEDGKPQWMAGTHDDITERKRFQEALELATDAAQASNRAKSQFLANMSHEIRTPMNGVMGMAQLLLDTRLDDEQREYTRIIYESAESLLTILNDILDFSKIEADRLEIELVAVELPDMLKHTIELMALRASENSLALRCRIDPEVPRWVQCDPVRLRQILVNLLGNAIKFTHEGAIDVHVAAGTPVGERVPIRFEIRDTGIGIPEDKLGYLFSPFSQVDATVTRRFGGTGLGLSISRRLVELMAGRIGVESVVGQGSTFWFEIPLSLAEAGSGTPQQAAAGGGRVEPGHVRILLVEDNPTNQKVTLAMLAKQGYQLALAEDGAQALDLLAREPFDLVLMDCQMPVMDGFEATRRLRANDPAVLDPSIPVIAMTASAMVEDQNHCYAVGMTDFISKPVNGQALQAAIQRVLGGHARLTAPGPTPLSALKASSPALIFDRETLYAELGGDGDLIGVTLESLLDDVPRRRDALVAALAAGDAETSRREAHTLKGLAKSGCAPELHATTMLIDHSCVEADFAEARMQLERLNAAIEAVLPRWRACLAEVST